MDDIREYINTHRKLRKARGSATSYLCIDCNEPAKQWSHRHDTNPEDFANYDPRCVKCHFAYDRPNGIERSEESRKLPWSVPHPDRSLSNESVLIIRELLSSGMSDRAIAKESGINRNVIRGIKSGRTYKDVRLDRNDSS